MLFRGFRVLKGFRVKGLGLSYRVYGVLVAFDSILFYRDF